MRTLFGTSPSLVGVVDRLGKQGLVGRRRSDADRRNVFVHATAEGRDLQRKVQPVVNAAYAELRQSIDDDTWQQLIYGLERLAPLDAESPAEPPTVNQ